MGSFQNHTSSGLTASEAQKRLREFGPNALPAQDEKSILIRLKQILREPMLLLLVAVALIYMIAGDLAESLLIAASALLVIGISYYEEQKSERALHALRELSSPRALVIRDGIEKRIPASDVVPGDLVGINEGDRIPADAEIVESSHLQIDESLLTGESFPVQKKIGEKVFSSTLVVKGRALISVTETGSKTAVGRIGESLRGDDFNQLYLSKEIARTVRLFAVAGLTICTLIVIWLGLTRMPWNDSFLIGLSTAMALLPEEFPVILSIFTAMGAWRLTQTHVLARNPQAIERLGAITHLCVDKTGTLTENKMVVACIASPSGMHFFAPATKEKVPEKQHEVVEFAVLASHLDPFDPMEKAIRHLLETTDWGPEHLHSDWELAREYPLSNELLAMSCVWRAKTQEGLLMVATKGAPEAVLSLCQASPEQVEEVMQTVAQMANAGLRVLGVAKASIPSNSPQELPSHQKELRLQWVGLVGLEDPLRQNVRDAVETCQRAGINVLMMTGDYPSTALKIAERAGLDVSGGALKGADLERMSSAEISEALRRVRVFARVIPEQKLKLVQALRDQKNVVAMSGDGVNDAPSLKAADVGVAMGERGTDVAREASDLVLTDDNFVSIVNGIRRGREIFKNIRVAMTYVGSVHVPIAGLAILPVILGWPLILLPPHIVFLELIIDPACSILFESRRSPTDVMNEPPRPIGEKLFASKDIIRSLLQGLLLLAGSIVLMWTLIREGLPADQIRGAMFIQVALSNIGLIIADLSGGSPLQVLRLFENKLNLMITSVLIGAVTLIFWIEPARHVFKMAPPDSTSLQMAVLTSVVTSTLVGIWNWIKRS